MENTQNRGTYSQTPNLGEIFPICYWIPVSTPRLEKLGVCGIQDTRAFSKTNEAGPDAVYVIHTIRHSLTKATTIRQYYLGYNCLNDNNLINKTNVS